MHYFKDIRRIFMRIRAYTDKPDDKQKNVVVIVHEPLILYVPFSIGNMLLHAWMTYINFIIYCAIEIS